METPREVKLPSGAVLKVLPSPFAVSKALYQAMLQELKQVTINSKSDYTELFKTLFSVGFSSPYIEQCLNECLKKCLYNDMRFDDQTFEPVKNRDDYMSVCFEVAKENVLPFLKSLYAEFQRVMSMIESTPK